MNITSKDPLNKLETIDEQILESILKNEYQLEEFTSMRYEVLQEDKVLIEYMINFSNFGTRTQFYRKANRTNDKWEMDDQPLILTYSNEGSEHANYNVNDLIADYISRKIT